MESRSTSWYVRLNGDVLSVPAFEASVVLTLTWPLLLQMQEFGSNYEAETLRNSKRTDLADVIVYIYDSSDTNSFSYISNLRVSIPPNLYTICPNRAGICGACRILLTIFVAYTATIQPRSYTDSLHCHQVGFRLGPAGTFLSLHIRNSRCRPFQSPELTPRHSVMKSSLTSIVEGCTCKSLWP